MNNFKLEKVFAENILDSRDKPTIKVSVCALNVCASFSVPSGASTGANEAHELRDGDGFGVEEAIKNVNELIAPKIIGMNIFNQKEIDDVMLILDGTKNKKVLGANAILGVSVAVAKLVAILSNEPTFKYLKSLRDIKISHHIPYLYMNLINGGKHSNNGLAFQEYMIVPETENVEEAVEIGKKVQGSLTEIIKRELGESSLIIGDEGGYAPKVQDVRLPLVYLKEAIEKNNFKVKVRFALDVAATSFYKDGFYEVNGEKLKKEELLSLYQELTKEFDFISIEDPFYEEDFESFREFREKIQNVLVVGDDLTVTNKNILDRAIKEKSISAMIVKLNQIGSLSETLDTMAFARENDIELIVSHRSGETMDDFIADLALAYGVFGLKSGSPLMKERMIKYQRLIDISKF